MIPQLSVKDFFDQLKNEYWKAQVIDSIVKSEASGAVLLRTQDLGLIASGRMQEKVLAIGASCTYKTVDDVKRLGELPSDHVYPVNFCTFPSTTFTTSGEAPFPLPTTIEIVDKVIRDIGPATIERIHKKCKNLPYDKAKTYACATIPISLFDRYWAIPVDAITEALNTYKK